MKIRGNGKDVNAKPLFRRADKAHMLIAEVQCYLCCPLSAARARTIREGVASCSCGVTS